VPVTENVVENAVKVALGYMGSYSRGYGYFIFFGFHAVAILLYCKKINSDWDFLTRWFFFR
jgi:hypothetical protein